MQITNFGKLILAQLLKIFHEVGEEGKQVQEDGTR
jgi:hypothetical protein